MRVYFGDPSVNVWCTLHSFRATQTSFKCIWGFSVCLGNSQKSLLVFSSISCGKHEHLAKSYTCFQFMCPERRPFSAVLSCCHLVVFWVLCFYILSYCHVECINSIPFILLWIKYVHDFTLTVHLKNLTDDILGVLRIKANVSVKRLCINIDCENLCFIK